MHSNQLEVSRSESNNTLYQTASFPCFAENPAENPLPQSKWVQPGNNVNHLNGFQETLFQRHGTSLSTNNSSEPVSLKDSPTDKFTAQPVYKALNLMKQESPMKRVSSAIQLDGPIQRRMDWNFARQGLSTPEDYMINKCDPLPGMSRIPQRNSVGSHPNSNQKPSKVFELSFGVVDSDYMQPLTKPLPAITSTRKRISIGHSISPKHTIEKLGHLGHKVKDTFHKIVDTVKHRHHHKDQDHFPSNPELKSSASSSEDSSPSSGSKIKKFKVAVNKKTLEPEPKPNMLERTTRVPFFKSKKMPSESQIKNVKSNRSIKLPSLPEIHPLSTRASSAQQIDLSKTIILAPQTTRAGQQKINIPSVRNNARLELPPPNPKRPCRTAPSNEIANLSTPNAVAANAHRFYLNQGGSDEKIPQPRGLSISNANLHLPSEFLDNDFKNVSITPKSMVFENYGHGDSVAVDGKPRFKNQRLVLQKIFRGNSNQDL